jgi:hypothetical protein
MPQLLTFWEESMRVEIGEWEEETGVEAAIGELMKEDILYCLRTK